MSISTIYLLKEREFVNSKEDVYKVGKTRQPNFERFRQYPKGSLILLYSECKDCDICEKYILSSFRKMFIKRTDIGAEYFEGDYNEMRLEINRIIFFLNQLEVHVQKIEKAECEEEFYVEKVLAHSGDFNDMDKMKFKIKWRDYGDKESTWEPWSNVKETEAMDKYLNRS